MLVVAVLTANEHANNVIYENTLSIFVLYRSHLAYDSVRSRSSFWLRLDSSSSATSSRKNEKRPSTADVLVRFHKKVVTVTK